MHLLSQNKYQIPTPIKKINKEKKEEKKRGVGGVGRSLFVEDMNRFSFFGFFFLQPFRDPKCEEKRLEKKKKRKKQNKKQKTKKKKKKKPSRRQHQHQQGCRNNFSKPQNNQKIGCRLVNRIINHK